MSESQNSVNPQVGECWGYKTRPHETESFVVIRKVEEMSNLSTVWHVSFFDVAVKNPTVPEKPIKYITHIPILEARLFESLTEKLDRSAPAKEWEEGYNIWRQDRGGVFDVTLRECVEIMEDIVNQ